ncbi:hypothetical protein UFOVP655_43 [uncultured Caudovirales phage]|uniref:Uncharacterized protein n=1 Tax=uncultured Caudovirales phage TaxID=2100421 RepID=A0A6J5N9E5_9CAUD|nr:hypothetical protein UFOVP655_43 [uncultured Caudovirales phage]
MSKITLQTVFESVVKTGSFTHQGVVVTCNDNKKQEWVVSLPSGKVYRTSSTARMWSFFRRIYFVKEVA